MTTPSKLHTFQVQLVYGLVGVLAIAVVVAAWHHDQLGLKELSGVALALFGTFIGATFAFRLNQTKEDKTRHSQRREALNRALFVIGRQFNLIHQLKKNFDAHLDPFDRALNLPAIKPPDYSKVVHNLADLEFLLESPDPSLLFQLFIEEERFYQVILAIEVRNDFYVGEFQMKVAQSGLNGQLLSMATATTQLGARVLGTLLNGTNSAYDLLTASERSLPEMQTALLTLAKKLYPNSKFITYAMSA